MAIGEKNLSSDTRVALDVLSRHAGLAMDDARSAPPALYVGDDVLALEQARIFTQDWLCAGLAADIAEPGDYLTYDIGDEPVICVRGRDGEIRSFSNVCRHRMMILAEGRGRAGRFVCPYHAWTYDLDGRLVGAPHLGNQSGFDKNAICLPRYRTEVWHGWIYITANDQALPLADLLGPLDEMVARYGAENYLPIAMQDHVWQTNWKLLCENFMEGYHLPVAHKQTVGAWMPVETTRFPESRNAAFTWQTFQKDETARYGRAHPDNDRLEGEWRYTTVMPTVFPAHMYILAPDHLWYLTLRPKGTGQVQVRFGVAVAPEVMAALKRAGTADEWIAETLAFFDKVNAEDRFLVEGIYKGACAPSATSGPLSWLEHEIGDFIAYLASRLCD